MRPENGSVKFGRETIKYGVERSMAHRRIAVAVEPSGDVLILAPSGSASDGFDNLVRKRAQWILDQRARFAEMVRPALKHYVSGESFLYLGRHYRLKVAATAGRADSVTTKLTKGMLFVRVQRGLTDQVKARQARESIQSWYETRARIRLAERIQHFADRLALPTPPFMVRNQLRRWGSCDRRGQIRINWRIIMAPMPVVDYLCAHEVCHLVYPNHSREFWQIVGGLVPNFEHLRERLRRQGPLFDLPTLLAPR